MNELATETILTPAETRIASGYAYGLIGKEIADACGVSYNTVVRHTQNIYDKTGIRRNTNALAAWFLSRNFGIDLDEFRRRLVGALLLVLLCVQTASLDFGNPAARRCSARRTEARRTAGRKGRRDERELDLLTL